jgi:thiosulfate/3-mercaptopyruvate sulfurtransferase
VILDGGLKIWRAEGRPIDGLVPAPRRSHFTARFDPSLTRTRDQVLTSLGGPTQIIDARPAPRFRGEAAEPRPGLRAGHIPGSRNLDHAQLIDPATGRVKPAGALRDLFGAAGVDLGRPIVTSCGSGVSACVLAFGLYLLGRSDVAVYDGSWAEWGLPDLDLPIETGPAKDLSSAKG